MEATLEKLQKAGLTGNESKVYLELLKQGELSANEIAKKLSLDRTLAYNVLNHLIKKGMVGHIIKENKKFFSAESPKNLLNPIKAREIFIKNLIPKLSTMIPKKDENYEVNVYEGKEGFRTLMRKIIENGSFCSYGATGKGYDTIHEMPALAKELQKKGFKARTIFHPKYKKHEMNTMQNLKTKYLDIEGTATTTIFGDKISIHVIAERPFAIVIKSPEIARTYQNHFEVLWKAAIK